ncbi:MAG: 3-oxoacyl-[acyl-carrier-protein] reductase [Chlamydiae bacterium RIFCSPHIGHO2_12_FULL_49_9]|nr:MAG: 3-oxoacyl-[acyl-carrier-protein] reductase [Chlamydiae bacterium RIFCSPHIGHO2_12_FULL_49_9]
MQLLKGKTALITGGTAGIGKAIACLFAANGADVAIFGTNQGRAEAALKEIESSKKDSSQKALYFLVDVSKTKEVEETIEKLLGDWGKIDILVNNAGITRDNLLMKMKEDDWDVCLDVNLKSVFNTCRALTRPMMKARGGSIINISSVIGLTGNAGQTNYAASKSGMIGFTKSIAKELASRNIRANCVAPGYIETQMTEALPEPVRKAILEKIPLGRIGQTLDIAQAVLFLASDQANYITGQVITVDGGMII